MKIIKYLNHFWFLPFLSFILGYYILSYFYPELTVSVPNITGKALQQAVLVTTKNNLSLNVLKELEDPDLPEGIILSQSPAFNQKAKKNQKIFVTISKKPKILNTSSFFDQSSSYISKDLEKLGLIPNFFWIESFYPINKCIAQSPEPGLELKDDNLIIYFSDGQNNFYIVPNLNGCKVKNLYDYLDSEKIYVDFFYKNRKANYKEIENKFVVDQKPMSGSIVDLSKKLFMQIQVG